MLNWIDKNERLPTEKQPVYFTDGFYIWNRTYDGDIAKHVTHWIPKEDIALPKRWRVPTIHDLAKAGEPIPCRVRDSIAEEWEPGELCAIDVQIECKMGKAFMNICGSWYRFCEIEA